MRQQIFKWNGVARQSVLVALVFAAAGALVAPSARAAGACTPTEASKPWYDKYMAGSDAAKKGDYGTAISSMKGAISAASQSCEKLHAMQAYASYAYNAKNWAELVAAAEMMNASDVVPAGEKTKNLLTISNAQQQLRRLDKALPPLQEYIKQTGGTPTDFQNLAEIQHALGNCPGTLQALDKATGGKPATESQLLLQNDCYVKGKDNAKHVAATEQLALRFPKKNYFVDLIRINQIAKIDDRALLNLYRLGWQKDFITEAEDIVNYAKLADASGASGEALRVLDQSVAKKRITLDDKSKSLEAQEKRAAADDAAAVAQLDKESQAGKNGDKDVKVGMMYFGQEKYAEASAALSRGLSADHVARVQRTDDANMALGIAYTRLKKYPDAEKAFNAAKADPRMTKAAEAWLALYKG